MQADKHKRKKITMSSQQGKREVVSAKINTKAVDRFAKVKKSTQI